MKPIQILLIAFVVFAMVRVFQKYRQSGLKTFEFLFWTAVWTGTAVIIAFPETTSFLAELLGIGRGTDLIIYSSLLIAFYLIFRIHVTLDHIEQEVTEIVREAALERLSGPGESGSAKAGQP